jgi:hypothetical protein
MPTLDGLGPAIAIALLLVVMLWFTFGTQRNIRRGNELLTWLQDGLPRIGPRTTLRWFGSSAVELTIVEPAAPFRDATIVVVLEPRDVGVLWAFARSRGRRDFIIFRTNLRQPPRISADVGDPTGWTGRLDPSDETGLQREAWEGGITAELDGVADERLIRDAWQTIAGASGGIWRLTVQPVVPHLEVHVLPPDRRSVTAGPLIEAVTDLASRLVRR